MKSDYDVISDFLDGEAFDAHALDAALAGPAGRSLLIDSVILRHAVQANEPTLVSERRPSDRGRRLLWAAAAVMVALAGGYQLGHSGQDAHPSTQLPSASRVVTVDWQPVTEEETK